MGTNAYRTLAAVLVLLLITTNSFWFLTNKNDNTMVAGSDQSASYPLLSKRIFAENQNDILINFVSLRKQITTELNKVAAPKSFYFEYLPSGTSVKIGEDTELIAASLIKVPIAMNMYKAAELGMIDLDKEVSILETQLDQGYGSLWQKGAGTRISLREAAKLALSESDNTAMRVMLDQTKSKLRSDQESLNNLDVDQNIEDGRAVINAKSYASILRSLYLSSYLERNHSQELLGYLAKSTATNRLTAKIPKEVVVAHKIGVYNARWSESDCGIVYVPKRPYMICIMIGLPDEESSKLIADISKLVYDYVTSQ